MPEDIVDLILESSRQHLVSLIQHELLDLVCPENLPGDHVEHAARGPHHDVLPDVQLAHVLPRAGQVSKEQKEQTEQKELKEQKGARSRSKFGSGWASEEVGPLIVKTRPGSGERQPRPAKWKLPLNRPVPLLLQRWKVPVERNA